MKTNLTIIKCLTVLMWGFSNLVQAQNIPVAHWINDAGLNVTNVLNTNGVFITDFKAHNDLKVTRLTANPIGSSIDVFGGATPGNNPAYLTNFVGMTNNGTGDGIAGDIIDLNTTLDSTGTLQFDFLIPLTSQDRILFVDVDGTEQYLLQAYVINGSSTNQVSFASWPTNNFSGTTGILPNSNWPVWNPTTGTLISGIAGNLNRELFVLTPAQNINRLVLTKQSGNAASMGITFLSLQLGPSLSIPNTNINEQALWQYTPTVSGSGYTFGLSNAPTGMSVDTNSGMISWVPTETQGPSTNVNITYAVYQSGFAMAWTNFTVIVNEVNVAPVLYVPGTQTIYATTTLTVTNTATDQDIPTNSLTFAIVTAPSGVALDVETGVLTWTPTVGQVGTNIITVSVTDNNPWAVNSQQLSVTNSFLVVVQALTPPSFTQTPVSQILAAGLGFMFTAQATGFPPPTYQWQFSINGVSYADISGATGGSYSLGSSGLTNIGYYRVVAANSQGTNIGTGVSLTFLNLNMYAGLEIVGPIGANYNIQANSNMNGSNWTTVTNISLPTQPYYWIDYTSPTNSKQFYRALPQ